MSIRTAAIAAALFSTAALAQDAAAPTQKEPVEAPSPDAVAKTWDYFYNGKGQGPVLAVARLCTEIAKEGDRKFECAAEVGPEGVKAGTNVMVWQAYLVPQGDEAELMIQLKQGDTVRETKDVKVKGEGWRARTWNGFRIPKPGDWTLVISYGGKELKTLTVKATK